MGPDANGLAGKEGMYTGLCIVCGVVWADLLVKGDTIDTDSCIERPFSRRLVPGDQNRKFDTVILTSHEDPEKLPSSFGGRE
jgi:hypothetical protein